MDNIIIHVNIHEPRVYVSSLHFSFVIHKNKFEIYKVIETKFFFSQNCKETKTQKEHWGKITLIKFIKIKEYQKGNPNNDSFEPSSLELTY